MFTVVVMAATVLVGQGDGIDADADLKLEVLRLVRRLDSRELAEREAAEKALIELGPKALELLPPLDDRTPAEIEQRLARVRVQLQKEQAQAAAANSTFTLSGERMSLDEIFAAIQEQTGNTIRFGRQGGPGAPPVRLPVDYTDAPFWPAFDEILDRAGLTLVPYNSDRCLTVAVAPDGMRPRATGADYDGPFRFQPVRVDASRDLRTRGNRSMSLTIEIAWEPRFRPISLQQRMDEVQLADENGEAVLIAARGAQLEIPASAGATSTELRIPLEAPPRTVQEISVLEGTLQALMQGKAETFEFQDLIKAKNVEKRSAGVTVTLQQVRKNRDVWEVRVITRFDNAEGALASHRTWVFDNPAKLISPDGEEIPFHAYDSTRQTENEVGIAYFFGMEGDLEGYIFVYETAADVLTAAFEYELTDIPLP